MRRASQSALTAGLLALLGGACTGPDDVVAHALPVRTEDGGHDDAMRDDASLFDECEGATPPLGPRIPAFAIYFADCALRFSEIGAGVAPEIAINELTRFIGKPIDPPPNGPAALACEARPSGWYVDDLSMPTAVFLCEDSCQALRIALLRQYTWDVCSSLAQDDAGTP